MNEGWERWCRGWLLGGRERVRHHSLLQKHSPSQPHTTLLQWKLTSLHSYSITTRPLSSFSPSLVKPPTYLHQTLSHSTSPQTSTHILLLPPSKPPTFRPPAPKQNGMNGDSIRIFK